MLQMVIIKEIHAIIILKCNINNLVIVTLLRIIDSIKQFSLSKYKLNSSRVC